MTKYKVAVVGATGNVGRLMLEVLAERKFPVSEVVALASRRSVGREVSFGDKKILKVQALEDYDWAGTDIALFSAGGSISAEYCPIAAAAGCVCIDNSSYFRMDKDVPLIVPEVNSDRISEYTKKNIIANPNCSTIQMVVPLKALHDVAKIKRVVVSTYQSVSGAGKEAMDELFNQTKGIYQNETASPQKFTKPIAFNVIPHIDVFMDDGNTKEEWKMVEETKKIFGCNIPVSATCVRVPVFVGHAESVNVEFEEFMDAETAAEILAEVDGITVFDRRVNGGYSTPKEVAGEDGVFISRIRDDASAKNAINFWCVADNLRKGAATNTVQIAEDLIANYNLNSASSKVAVN
jgi:aspartate-semialdehyde dehydrogenase